MGGTDLSSPGPERGTDARRTPRGAFIRYVLVGLVNAGLDLGLFTVLAVVVNVPPLLAHVISTSITLSVSYVLNRAYVFRTRRSVQATVAQFVAVTLFSALVVQSAVIWAILSLGEVVAPGVSSERIAPLAKVCAMGAGIATNYFGYRWLFRSDGRSRP